MAIGKENIFSEIEADYQKALELAQKLSEQENRILDQKHNSNELSEEEYNIRRANLQAKLEEIQLENMRQKFLRQINADKEAERRAQIAYDNNLRMKEAQDRAESLRWEQLTAEQKNKLLEEEMSKNSAIYNLLRRQQIEEEVKRKLKLQQLQAEKELLEAEKEAAETAEDRIRLQEDINRKQQEIDNNSEDEVTEGERAGKKIAEWIASKLSEFVGSIFDKVDQNISLYSQYMGKVDARLQTLDTTAKTLNSIHDVYDKSFGMSPFVQQAELYKAVDKLSSEGISYNIEERAFLSSIADKMVASFNVSNQTLTNLIRLYQQDITQALLGNEAMLTQIFNTQYEDSSYLANNYDESVLNAISTSMALMDVNSAIEYQYQVQKWLGSLYEVGVSSETVMSMANAINALGSGNANAFTDSSIGVLLNMALRDSGYSVADALTQGVTPDLINDLMASVITILHDIKDNTSNQVTLAAYADTLGISVADIRGFYNLYGDIASLKGYTTNLLEAESEVEAQLVDIINERTTFAEQFNNVIDNLGVSLGFNIADKTGTYVAWKLGGILTDLGQTVGGLTGNLLSKIGYGDRIAVLLSAFGDAMDTGDTHWYSFLPDFIENLANLFNYKTWENVMNNLKGETMLSFIENSESVRVVGDRGLDWTASSVVNTGGTNIGTAYSALATKANNYGAYTVEQLNDIITTSGVSKSVSLQAPTTGDDRIEFTTPGQSKQYDMTPYESNEIKYNNQLASSTAAYTQATTGLNSLATYDEATTSYSVTGAEGNAHYTDDDVFQELFFKHDHPIWVSVKDFQLDALKQLEIEDSHSFRDRLLTAFLNVLSGNAVNVDLINNDVQTLLSAIRSA